jgi:hypothetical protein
VKTRTLLACSAVAIAAPVLLWIACSCRQSEHSGLVAHTPNSLSQGNEVVEMDFNGDGVSDVFYYYSNSVAVKLQMDRNFDGRMDYLEFYAKSIPCRSQSDDDFDGIPDMWVDYKWGQPFVARQDTDSNGIPDVIYVYTNGIIGLVSYQPNSTGPVVRETKYIGGRLAEDIFYGGTSNSLLRLAYDCYGRITNIPEAVLEKVENK